MGMVGVAALVANGGVALMLYRFRSGDANMRTIAWIKLPADNLENLRARRARADCKDLPP
jgi:Co/Zn/Cd efflux system component